MRSIVVCDGDEADKHSYISESNILEILIEQPDAAQDAFRFLLKYEGRLLANGRLSVIMYFSITYLYDNDFVTSIPLCLGSWLAD